MAVDLAVVPVAGRGTRLLPLTKSQPKEMLAVGDKPVVQFVVEELAGSGVASVVFVTGPGKTAIENHFDIDEPLITHLRENGQESLLARLDYERRELSYCYTRQPRQLGLGHAVLCAKSIVGDKPFVVALGDTIIGVHAKSKIVARMIEVFEEQQCEAVIAFEEVAPEDVQKYGIADPGVEGDGYFEVKGLIEKPAPDEAPSNRAIAGRYVFSSKIFAALEKTERGRGDEIQLTDAISRLIDQGGRVLGVPLDEPRFDIGAFSSYYKAFVEFALDDPECGDELREHLRKLLAQSDNHR